jgi:hypothetical protein
MEEQAKQQATLTTIVKTKDQVKSRAKVTLWTEEKGKEQVDTRRENTGEIKYQVSFNANEQMVFKLNDQSKLKENRQHGIVTKVLKDLQEIKGSERLTGHNNQDVSYFEGRGQDAVLDKNDSHPDFNNEILKKSRFIKPPVATSHWQIVAKKPRKEASVRKSKDVNCFKYFLPRHIKSQCKNVIKCFNCKKSGHIYYKYKKQQGHNLKIPSAFLNK